MEETKSDVKRVELPFYPQMRSETGPEIAFRRRQEIVEQYVRKLGIKNARTFTKQIAEKYKIGERQVRKDFQWITGNFKPEDVRAVQLDLKILRDKTLSLALLNIEAAQSATERNDAIKTAWTVIEKYRQDLEEWGEKPKIAEKHEVLSKNISLEIIRHDGREENTNQDGIEQEAIRSLGYPSG